jgi:hypothetical protein
VTVLDAPPLDHSPQIVSADINDFAIPTGREEEWRFAPTDELRRFMDHDPEAGTITSSG